MPPPPAAAATSTASASPTSAEDRASEHLKLAHAPEPGPTLVNHHSRCHACCHAGCTLLPRAAARLTASAAIAAPGEGKNAAKNKGTSGEKEERENARAKPCGGGRWCGPGRG